MEGERHDKHAPSKLGCVYNVHFIFNNLDDVVTSGKTGLTSKMSTADVTNFFEDTIISKKIMANKDLGLQTFSYKACRSDRSTPITANKRYTIFVTLPKKCCTIYDRVYGRIKFLRQNLKTRQHAIHDGVQGEDIRTHKYLA